MTIFRSPLALVVLTLALALSFFVVHVETDCGSCGTAFCSTRARGVRLRDLVRRILGNFIARLRAVAVVLVDPVPTVRVVCDDPRFQLALAPLRI